MGKIYQDYKFCILKIANQKYPLIRKREYELDHYLNNFVHVLKHVTTWSAIKELHINANTSEFHWVAVKNEYYRWVNDNVFKEAYDLFTKNNYKKFAQISKNKRVNLFIDVTKATNLHGSENVGINGEYKKKNVTGISAICDDKKFSLSLCPLTVNEKHEKYSTLHHDITAVQKTLDEIPVIIPSYVKINIVGDKGYCTSEKFTICDREQCIITPLKEPKKTKKEIEELQNKINNIKEEEKINIKNTREYYNKQIVLATKTSKNEENKLMKDKINNEKKEKMQMIKDDTKIKVMEIKKKLGKCSKETLQNAINNIKNNEKKEISHIRVTYNKKLKDACKNGTNKEIRAKINKQKNEKIKKLREKLAEKISEIKSNSSKKGKNTKYEIKILKLRHKIENLFADLKKNNRILVRRDRLIKNYMSFLYMGALEHNCKLVNKM